MTAELAHLTGDTRITYEEPVEYVHRPELSPNYHIDFSDPLRPVLEFDVGLTSNGVDHKMVGDVEAFFRVKLDDFLLNTISLLNGQPGETVIADATIINGITDQTRRRPIPMNLDTFQDPSNVSQMLASVMINDAIRGQWQLHPVREYVGGLTVDRTTRKLYHRLKQRGINTDTDNGKLAHIHSQFEQAIEQMTPDELTEFCMELYMNSLHMNYITRKRDGMRMEAGFSLPVRNTEPERDEKLVLDFANRSAWVEGTRKIEMSTMHRTYHLRYPNTHTLKIDDVAPGFSTIVQGTSDPIDLRQLRAKVFQKTVASDISDKPLRESADHIFQPPSTTILVHSPRSALGYAKFEIATSACTDVDLSLSLNMDDSQTGGWWIINACGNLHVTNVDRLRATHVTGDLHAVNVGANPNLAARVGINAVPWRENGGIGVHRVDGDVHASASRVVIDELRGVVSKADKGSEVVALNRQNQLS